MKTLDLAVVSKNKWPAELLSLFDMLEEDEPLVVRGGGELIELLEMVSSTRPDEFVWSMVESGPSQWVSKIERLNKWNPKKGGCCGCGCG